MSSALAWVFHPAVDVNGEKLQYSQWLTFLKMKKLKTQKLLEPL